MKIEVQRREMSTLCLGLLAIKRLFFIYNIFLVFFFFHIFLIVELEPVVAQFPFLHEWFGIASLVSL